MFCCVLRLVARSTLVSPMRRFYVSAAPLCCPSANLCALSQAQVLPTLRTFSTGFMFSKTMMFAQTVQGVLQKVPSMQTAACRTRSGPG